ncbi:MULTISPECIES: cell division protein FtsL [Microbulbifer]|uniref:cell division protein FtsL n=1 Tax=Microbulbifer TaxID=48073 RepID=UPI001E3F9112|nr:MULTISPECIES: cell division protein FtsL [Microbulbifer]UHQ54848.1 cell division protein FtsL [Microbulbifer sp. YPW16]
MNNRRMLIVAFLWVATLVSALGVVHTTQSSRALTAELVQAQKQRDELRYEQERLLLERGAWSAYSRIEREARDKLGMRAPEAGERIIVPVE